MFPQAFVFWDCVTFTDHFLQMSSFWGYPERFCPKPIHQVTCSFLFIKLEFYNLDLISQQNQLKGSKTSKIQPFFRFHISNFQVTVQTISFLPPTSPPPHPNPPTPWTRVGQRKTPIRLELLGRENRCTPRFSAPRCCFF